MEIRELRSLIALADLGSIARASTQLNLTSAAIHKQLKMLESDLGVKLYEKVGRGLQLTAAAHAILPHVRDLLAHYEATVNAANEWKGLKHGLIRIGAGPTMSSYLLPSLLESFRETHPAIELFIETGSTYNLANSLRRGLLDVAFMVSSETLDKPNLTIEATWDFEIAIVAGARHTPRRCRINDLQDSPFILYKEGSFFDDIIESYFKEFDFHPRVVMRLDNAEAIKAMVQSNLGLAMLPVWALRGELKNKKLAVIRQHEKPLYASVALMTRLLSHQSHPVRAFTKIASRWKWESTQLNSQTEKA